MKTIQRNPIEPFNSARPYRVSGGGPFTVIGGNVHPLEIRGTHTTREGAEAQAKQLNDRFEDLLKPRSKEEMKALFAQAISQ